MTRAEIFDKITDIIADRFETDRDQINEQLNFKKDLDADSIDFVEFVLELEDTFNAEISDEDAEKLMTVGEVVDYIVAHQTEDK
ncbi:acyl carrier protein [Levilactobacillus parabrevis]|uniref:acyl carrier protein n=1 Tax=Levilactobacillus parabrevis TaxID=357278 RepID=UPI0021A7E878|nr:acyl carrier protein [Levilactobacillus parabrevis]MCT4488751.1 acyl carrier protein [Levilactobacillus parabrevis]MCT4490253.1 acyl carrier protein [Levilactobacillus parabrevis]